ncbi:hypothetical protein DFP72DRAFT_1047381 [Ephemerocybe angulata]|uniref:Uncharacterized protein n=1 Tax=Ephemerocybe angulata TaxID=980116 RepID=A0A8H6HSI1_9AGAR|nr:hypothetical protein DFP72DRAFT_1047381 [Tulosesus angulatus]
MSHYHSQSPPPLRHPVSTHPAYIPEPPSTPSSPQGYQRFSSSPGPGGPVPAQPLPPPHLQHHMQQQGQGQGQPIHPGPMHPQQQQQGHVPYVPAYAGAFQGSYGGGVGGSMGGGNMAGGNMGGVGGHAGSFQPSFGAWGINATAQLGMQLGQSAVAAGQDYVQLMAIVTYILLTGLHAGIHVPPASAPKSSEGQPPARPSSSSLTSSSGLHELHPRRDEIRPLRARLAVSSCVLWASIVQYILPADLHAVIHVPTGIRPFRRDSVSRHPSLDSSTSPSCNLGSNTPNIQDPSPFIVVLEYTGHDLFVDHARDCALFLVSGPVRNINGNRVGASSWLGVFWKPHHAMKISLMGRPSLSRQAHGCNTHARYERSRRLGGLELGYLREQGRAASWVAFPATARCLLADPQSQSSEARFRSGYMRCAEGANPAC